MAKLWENTEALEAILETLQTKAAGGGSNSKPILYGTYILRENLVLSNPIHMSEDFYGHNVYTHFYTGSGYEYHYTERIVINGNQNTAAIYYEIDSEPYSTDYNSSEQSWMHYIEEADEYIRVTTNSPSRIIDFKEPVEVTNDFYKLFMEIVDNTDTTPYDIGYQSAIADGEAAEITYDSTYKTLTITTG
jgi:hypothetical protein